MTPFTIQMSRQKLIMISMGRSGCLIQNACHNCWNQLPHLNKFSFVVSKKKNPIVFPFPFYFYIFDFLVSFSLEKNYCHFYCVFDSSPCHNK